jgi:hypothetical protein
MKTNSFIFLLISVLIAACQPEKKTDSPTEANTPSVPSSPTAPVQPSNNNISPIDHETDFILEYNVGIINGSQAPDSVKVQGNGRYFDFGAVEVRTQGTATLSGEVIQYRPKGVEEWLLVAQEDHLFFLGYDGQRHLIIDKGSTTINRDIRLFDIQNGSFTYRSKYNNTLVKDGSLYLLRFVDASKISNLPNCDTTSAQVRGYEEVIAVSLSNYQEAKTGQVFCVYK